MEAGKVIGLVVAQVVGEHALVELVKHRRGVETSRGDPIVSPLRLDLAVVEEGELRRLAMQGGEIRIGSEQRWKKIHLGPSANRNPEITCNQITPPSGCGSAHDGSQV